MSTKILPGLCVAALLAAAGAFATDTAAAPPAAAASAAPKATSAAPASAPSTPAPPIAAAPGAAKAVPTGPKGSVSITPVEPRQPHPLPIVQRWEQIDADKDGKASFAEVKQVLPEFSQARFDFLDKNHDGFITQDELPKPGGFSANHVPVAAVASVRMFEIADKDHDGKITPEEYKEAFPNQPEGRFKELDKNGDGIIDKDDQPSTMGGYERADANGDGKISREEFMAAFPKSPPDRFGKLDKNGDGFIDDEDRKMSAPPAGAAASAPGKQDWSAVMATMLAQYDTNKDGKITFEEFSAGKPGLARTGFDNLDTNKDGVLTADEKAPERPVNFLTGREAGTSEQAAERMKRADKNGDGKLSFEEAVTEFKSLTRAQFDARDLNGDGFLGPEDRAMRQAGITAPVKKVKGAGPASGAAPAAAAPAKDAPAAAAKPEAEKSPTATSGPDKK